MSNFQQTVQEADFQNAKVECELGNFCGQL